MLIEISDLFASETTLEVVASAKTYLFHTDAPVQKVFFVLEGQVNLIRRSEAGQEIILQRAVAKDVLAEASVWSAHYHCDARVEKSCRLLTMPRPVFQQRLAASPDLAETWAKHLARSVQAARMRAEIRTLKTVAARFDLWLAEFGPLPPRGEYQNVAAELGVSREAFYRELARRAA